MESINEEKLKSKIDIKKVIEKVQGQGKSAPPCMLSSTHFSLDADERDGG